MPIRAKINVHAKTIARSEAAPREPSILSLGYIWRDHKLFEEELKKLYEPTEYHGRLQVMLSALRRMEQKMIALIDEFEG